MRTVRRERKEPVLAPAPAPRRRAAPRGGRVFAHLGLSPQKPFGKRGRGLVGRIASVALIIRRNGLRFLSFGAITSVLLLGLGAYGLVAAGHVDRWAAAAMAAAYGATAQAGLGIETVTLTGRERLSREDVLAALGISRGDPILAFDAEAARARLLQLAWVRDARIAKRLPDTVIVQVVEKRPFAIWQNGGRMVLIDRAGDVITAEGIANFPDLPMVVDAGANLAAAELVDRLRQHPRIAREVRAAVYVGERRWDLHMKNGIAVMLPERAVTLGLVRLERLILEKDVLRRAVHVIDLRLPGQTTYDPMPETGALPGDAT